MIADKLTLIVENTERLDAHSKATATFDPTGGVIGSSGDCDWVLRDRAQSVADHQIQVFRIDGHFAIEVLASDGLFVNKAARPTRKGETLRVTDGDDWVIGGFEVGVFVTYSKDGSSDDERSWENRFLSMENLVPGALSKDAKERQNRTEELLLSDGPIDRGDTRLKFLDQSGKKAEIDPLRLMDEDQTQVKNLMGADPLMALNQVQDSKVVFGDTELAKDLRLIPEEASELTRVLDPEPGQENFTFPIHRRSNEQMAKSTEQSSADVEDMEQYLSDLVDGSKPGRSPRVSQKRGTELVERDSWVETENYEGDGLLDHIILRPLLSSMGLNVSELTGPQADRLAAEVGEAVKAAVEGIIALYSRRHADRSVMNETHLHPVEDNPLRLENDPNVAINDLFLNQSPVHLKANIAIEEGLKQAAHHEEASEIAVTAALHATLNALEPARLSSRFARYRGHAPRVGDMDSWHWQMYQHYYNELNSDRQGGLGRMFREVFQQVYDREMRSRSIED